ncbi:MULTISPECIES: LysR family transcriptional regulator [Marinobacter]|jgi:LysR family glycine cleavage system transcriptional activator|uniref:LysR family transcriptional regulator n=1 Tax=Marinobacter TaxID=2742 RepID=UPI0029430D59|nr:LysR family transcriptional regulator [Marinobacter salarius]WOI20373.1 LysR family transcriptional regulator [Marinobacter salarius]
MKRKIPSTVALTGFECAARHQSFTKAAEELSLTQSAVHRQIAGLEELLGVKLFKRSRQGVRLTDAGVNYYKRITVRLDELERDTLDLMGDHRADNSIELAVVPTFGARWLMPRFQSFRKEQPNITVNLTNRTRPFLFADTQFDAAIYFGDGDWPGTETYHLMHENPTPVCSPELIKPSKTLTVEDISKYTLLQQTTRPYAWREWFLKAGLKVERDLAGPRYELFTMLAQAAIHHMGIALIPPFLIREELESEKLVMPIQHSFESKWSYHFVLPNKNSENAPVCKFRDWLIKEVRSYKIGAS